MRIGKVIGKVTLSRCHPSLTGSQYRMVVPLTLDDLTDEDEPQAEPFVMFDELGAGHGCRIAISEGGEAAQPFYPDLKPVDAYNAAILDTVSIQQGD